MADNFMAANEGENFLCTKTIFTAFKSAKHTL